MAIRKIIRIEEDKCDGCGLCVPNCVEGAIQIIGGKARLVKDSYCDGLGACLGHCPQDALHIIERDADEFDEEGALEFAKKMNEAKEKSKTFIAQRGQSNVQPHAGGCPGSRMMSFGNDNSDSQPAMVSSCDIEIRIKPQLRQWPVQLNLVPVTAPYFNNADLLVTADCVPVAYADYHLELLKGRAVVIGCPKLDDIQNYTEKLTDIFSSNNIRSTTVAFMEVPCCGGIVRAVETAVANSGKNIKVTKVKIGIKGDRQ